MLGKFKDELNTLLMTEFVALRPKVYSIKHQMLNECKKVKTNRKKTRKGVPKVVVKKEIKHGNYVTVIETNEIVKHEVVSIRSFNHQLYTFKQQQLALTLFYDKMQMLGNINCIPYGLSRNPKTKTHATTDEKTRVITNRRDANGQPVKPL